MSIQAFDWAEPAILPDSLKYCLFGLSVCADDYGRIKNFNLKEISRCLGFTHRGYLILLEALKNLKLILVYKKNYYLRLNFNINELLAIGYENSQRAVLAILLLDGPVFNKLSEVLNEAYFTDVFNKEVYLCIVSLAKQGLPFDIIAVSKELSRNHSLRKTEDEILCCLTEYGKAAPTSVNELLDLIYIFQATKKLIQPLQLEGV